MNILPLCYTYAANMLPHSKFIITQAKREQINTKSHDRELLSANIDPQIFGLMLHLIHWSLNIVHGRTSSIRMAL